MGENNNFFKKGNYKNIVERGFQLTKDNFFHSYIIKFLSAFLILLINFFMVAVIEFILKYIDINPELLPFLIFSIVFSFLYVTLTINYIIDASLYHISVSTALGKDPSVFSIKTIFNHKNKWLLLSFFVLIFQAIYLIAVLLLMEYVGEMGITIFAYAINIILLILSPMIHLVIPLIVVKKLNVLEALKEGFKLGKKYYKKAMKINLVIIGIITAISQIFNLLFRLFSYTSASHFHFALRSHFIPLGTSYNQVIYIILLISYITIVTVVEVIAINLRMALALVIIGEEEKDNKDIYNQVYNNLSN